MSIRITETEQEYLLSIPAGQRERAKEIEGRSWDPERKVWIYPRTKRMYRALLAEFRHDLQKVEITSPDLDADTKKSANMEAENAGLQNRIEELEKRIEELSTAKVDAKISVFQSTIAELKSKINDLETELGVKQNETEEIKNDYARLLKESMQQPGDSLNENIKKLAVLSTGNNKTFECALNAIGISEQFPSEFQKILMHRLCDMLSEEYNTLNLFELLERAKESDLIPSEALDLAHTIRKQRNVFMHHDIDPNTRQIRILYFVIAYSLLWPHLEESESE